jgi:uncharacterized protein YwqG
MAQLLVEDPAALGDATIGGTPRAPSGTKWPTCRTCGGPMQFLSQLPLKSAGLPVEMQDKVLLLFQCQNDPGMCDEWDANSGGNAALLVSPSASQSLRPPSGPTVLARESRVRLVPYDDSASGETADDAYCSSVDAKGSTTLGKLGGRPLWMQSDETPQCSCGAKMTFVLQLEARGGGGINFGDAGTGYAFVCESCATSAKFLWQCA